MTWNFVLYLLYGLAFFTLGVAILSRDLRLSELGIARILWILAAFGISHGFHEWVELLEQFNPEILTPSYTIFRLTLVSISFFCLLYFGIFMFFIAYSGDQGVKNATILTKFIIGIVAFVLLGLAFSLDINNGTDFYVRRIVAFPGGLLAGLGLIAYSRTVRVISKNVATNFIYAGVFMVWYAVFTGLFRSTYHIPFFGVEIILLRGVCAFFIMFYTIRGLSVFSLEQRILMDERLQRFAQSEKLTSMGLLAAGVAHEINNPLTNASLNLEMLRDLVKGEEKVNKKLASIDRNIDRASAIAKELLNFSREKVTSFELVDLNEVLKSSCNLIQSQKFSTKIQLHLGDIPKVMGVHYKLEEVVINLLMNSIDACGPDDVIDVETFHKADHVVVEITDTGHGIHSDLITEVFDPFFTTKEVGKGTGLGLSVCYNIIKQHNGDITLVSSDQGGAIMTITLPVPKKQ